MNKLKIIPYKKKFQAEILELHKIGFCHLGKKDYSILRKEIENSLDIGDAVMAMHDGQVVGFESFQTIQVDPSKKEHIESKLYYAQHREYEDYIKDHYQKYAVENGVGQVVVEYFHNIFTQEKIKVFDNDYYINAIVVHPDYQKRGIGQMIITETISISNKNDVSTLYVDSIEKSGSESLYAKMGYLPIIRLGPTHHDGSSSVLMGFQNEIKDK